MSALATASTQMGQPPSSALSLPNAGAPIQPRSEFDVAGLRSSPLTSHRPLAERWSRPDLGRTPTGKWLLGELVPDRLAVVIPSSTPPGQYRLLAGLGTRASAALVPVGDIRVQ